MPELPEVEQFRQLLLPLVSNEHPLKITLVGENHRRISLTEEELKDIGSCTEIVRKGKQLCLYLGTKGGATKFLMLHMGMTGRIRVDGIEENWGGKSKKMNGSGGTKTPSEEESFPPKYTYLVFEVNGFTACFCDPRKFGSCHLADDLSALEELAPDALECKDEGTLTNHVLPKLANQRLGIKAILLDQKRAVSGVGNWVADEVLYQCQIHPDQPNLTIEQSRQIWETLQSIVSTAVNALKNDTHYPESWLFGYRWTKKKASKDSQGRNITFVTSGGRTSAIVASVQKLYKSQRPTTQLTKNKTTTIAAKKGVEVEKTANSTTRKRKSRDDLQRFKYSAAASSYRKDRTMELTVLNVEADASTEVVDPPRRRSPRFISP